MASTSTEPPKPQPWPSRNSRPASRWDGVSWSVVICRTDAGDSSRRPPALPPASSIRAKRCQSPAVETRPPLPEGNAGLLLHCRPDVAPVTCDHASAQSYQLTQHDVRSTGSNQCYYLEQ